MPRHALENTTPMRVRIQNADLARIDNLYKYIGIHGSISDVIRKGTRLQVYIEEVQRERTDASDAVKSAIHTLQIALDGRDRDAYDAKQIEKSQLAEESKASKESGSKPAKKAKRAGKRESKKVSKDATANV